jgi:cytochrome c oxidase subunit II
MVMFNPPEPLSEGPRAGQSCKAAAHHAAKHTPDIWVWPKNPHGRMRPNPPGSQSGMVSFPILAIVTKFNYYGNQALQSPKGPSGRRLKSVFSNKKKRGDRAMTVAIIFAVLVFGSIIFSLMSPWWFTPLASNWGTIDTTLIITFVITGVVFCALVLFMAYALFRFRHREGVRASYEPESGKLELWLTGLTSVGIAAMLAPGLVVWKDYVTVPPDATTVEVLGQQWGWTFRFPGGDGILGTVDAKRIDADNPFGLNPDDPHGQDDVLVDGGEVRLPVDKPVKLELRSVDVLHDFYVPQFRAKMDLVPGMITYFWLTPTRTGTFEILCAELCGVGHSAMRGTVVVVEPEAHQTWLNEYPTFAQAMNGITHGTKLAETIGTGRADGQGNVSDR